ncbi:bifunctional glutamate N-acetyltransferase/amino-acid acetyltransferase ArgJ [Candidatus Cyanaurora vandensis]|uniref:bifunctional glutamate N-acetyltransferase/amino-acid acetyltransferase ArgJ n=1 Tax=Candidatus Cyanaurora vandensis TaxID=2714958 RepID=UPI0025795626|nr:bifunctional glutamate N-acetyltransferase/amino-acid acetyltransferase ArgJ [Candidatus Cyanaurora vandensis]
MATFWAIEGGVTAPLGWQAGAVAAGIKPSGKLDLILICSDQPAVTAGVFTTNLVRAASVDYDEQRLAQESHGRAIVINAGNANAATGQAGVEAVTQTAQIFAELLNLDPAEILVASTGVIGVPLPMAKIQQAAPQLVTTLSPTGSELAAQAILTTDLTVKTRALEANIDGHPVRMGAIAKGSGMIHPNMATLLAFITCDAAVEPDLWRDLLRAANTVSFNQITVDGDTSTNDLVLALSNGRAENPTVTDPASLAARLLGEMLTTLCIDLAKMVARDGEGATKLVEVQVTGARDAQSARQVARTVASSSLFKAALFGCDPNWGRIAAAAGRAGVPFAPQRLAVWLGEVQLMAEGTPLPFDRPAAVTYLKNPTVLVRLDLGGGQGQGTAWGCDLTYDYVRINGEYTT